MTSCVHHLRAQISFEKIICGEKRLSATGSQPSAMMSYMSGGQSVGFGRRRLAENSRCEGVRPCENISHSVVAYAQISALKSNLACSR